MFNNNRDHSFLFVVGKIFLLIQLGRYSNARKILEIFVTNDNNSKTREETEIILKILPQHDLKMSRQKY